MTMQRVKQVQGLSFCCDIAPRSCCSLLRVWIEGGWIFLWVWASFPPAGGGAAFVFCLFQSIPTPKEPKPTPKAIKISACLMKPNIFVSTLHTMRPMQPQTSHPLQGHSPWNPLAQPATASKLEHRHIRISWRRNLAFHYKTESLKNLRTFGSISYLVNRTPYIFMCILGRIQCTAISAI